MVSPRRSTLRLLLLAAMPAGSGACTLVGGGLAGGPSALPVAPEAGAYDDRRGGTDDPSADRPSTASDGGERRVTTRVVDVALASIGTPYEWGGSDGNGFDCSGLIQFAYGELGIPIPRTSAAQIRSGSPVAPEPARLRPGDILGFSDDGGKTEHVGLYIGGDDFIHSSSRGVRISSLRNRYWRESLVAARRIVD